MKLGRLNHVGVATPNLNSTIALYRDVLGATDITESFDMPEQGVRVCFINTSTGVDGVGGMNGTQIELITPLDESSPVFGFIEKNSLGGQHHVCFEVPDIEAARTHFEQTGKRILGSTRIGAHGTPIFFLHPKDMNGMLTEIMETPRAGH